MLPFIPLAVSAIGSVLGEQALRGIGEAIAGSPTESEARARVAPLFNTAVAKLRAQGMSGADAEKQAATEVQGYVQEEMGKSNMPEWVSGALSLVGLVGGGAVAGKMAAKALGKVGFGAAKAASAKAASTADAAVIDPLKAKAAGAVAEGSGKAAEGAALKSHGPFPPAMGNKPAPNMKPVDRDIESAEIPGAPDELEPMADLVASPVARKAGPFPRLGPGQGNMDELLARLSNG